MSKQLLKAMIMAQPHRATASGSLIHLDKAEFADAIRCVVSFSPVQAGSGDPSPSNVRPISGWTGVNVTVNNVTVPVTFPALSKNLLKNTASSTFISGIQYDVLSDGRVHAYGTATGEASLFVPFGDLRGDYLITGCPSGGGNSRYDVYPWDDVNNRRAKAWDGTTNAGTDTGTTFIQTKIQTATEGLRLRVYNGQTVDITFTPMVCAASEASTTFAPYTTTAYKGSVDLTNGSMVVTHGSMLFTGDSSETWSIPSGTTGVLATIADGVANTTGTDTESIISDYLPAAPRSSIYSGGVSTGICLYNGNRIWLRVSGITTVSAWTAYLAEHPLRVVFKLASSNVYQVPPATLKLLRGENTVYSDSNGNLFLNYWTH